MSISSEQFFKNFFEQVGGTETDNKIPWKKIGIIIGTIVIAVLIIIFALPKLKNSNKRGEGHGDGIPNLFSNTDEENTKQK